MRRFRFLLPAAGALAALLLLALGVAGNSTFQTWAARRAFAKSATVRIEIGRVEAGWGHLRVEQLTVVRGDTKLTAPRLEAEFSWWQLWREERLTLGQLSGSGWILELDGARKAPLGPISGVLGANGTAAMPAGVAAGTAAVLHAFHGLFAPFRLPVDLAVEKVALQGTVVGPGQTARVVVTVAGGGLRAGTEGSFDVTADAALSAAVSVATVSVRGTVKATLDTPRSFSALAVRFDAEARGPAWPRGVKLTAGATAARGPSGEIYSARIVGEERQLFTLKAELPRDGSRIDGGWKLDVQDGDVSPFLLGTILPRFALTGEGVFDADASFATLHVGGRIQSALDQLQQLGPELASIGAVNVAAEFDLLRRADVIALQKMEVEVAGTKPVATVKLLQPVEWDPASGAARLRETSREFASINLQGLPIAWLRPWTADWDIAGEELRGELSAAVRAGGLAVRSRGALTATGIKAGDATSLWVRDVDASATLQADVTPKGWQAELGRVIASSGGATFLTGEIRLGRLTGTGQPLKATVRASSDLAHLRRQPLGGAAVPIGSGRSEVDLVISAGEKLELQGSAAWRGVKGIGAEAMVEYPDGSARVRVSIDGAGDVAVNLPLVIEQAGRKSDLLLVGKLSAKTDAGRSVSAQLTGDLLHLEQVGLIGGLFASPRSLEASGHNRSPWHGWHGEIAVQLKQVFYAGDFELKHVSGHLRLEREAVTLEGLKFGLAETGSADLRGRIIFDATQASSALTGEIGIELREIDAARLLGGAIKTALPIEGRFDVSSALRSQGETIGALWSGLGGPLQLTSRGGVFRAIPVSVGTVGDSSSTIAALLTSASSMIGGIRGRRDTTDITNRSQAITEFARSISSIAFDQLAVVGKREKDGSVTVNDFSLIAPELRLQGTGRTQGSPPVAWSENAVSLDLSLRARGRTAELLRYLGLLEAQIDTLGYAGCTVPIGIGGTLGNIDASETSRRLVAAAFEKAGFIDKAAEWLAKQRGRVTRGGEGSQDAGK